MAGEQGAPGAAGPRGTRGQTGIPGAAVSIIVVMCIDEQLVNYCLGCVIQGPKGTRGAVGQNGPQGAPVSHKYNTITHLALLCTSVVYALFCTTSRPLQVLVFICPQQCIIYIHVHTPLFNWC